MIGAVAKAAPVEPETLSVPALTVVVPEFLLSHWWEQLLHNQSALVLRTRLRLRPNTVVVAVPVHLDAGEEAIY